MSQILCAHLWRPLTQESLLELRARYLVLSPHCFNQIDGTHLSQYYGIAAGMILFYDHLLTLDDEVGSFHRDRAPRSDSTNRPAFRRSNISGLERNPRVRPPFEKDVFFPNLIFGQDFGFSLLSVSSTAFRSICSLTGVPEPVLSDDVSDFSACASVLCFAAWTLG